MSITPQRYLLRENKSVNIIFVDNKGFVCKILLIVSDVVVWLDD